MRPPHLPTEPQSDLLSHKNRWSVSSELSDEDPGQLCYLAASLLFEGSGDERRVSLDHRHILYPPALRQLGVRGDLDELEAHLLPQGSCQAAVLTLGFGQVHGDLPVLPSVSHSFPTEGLRNATHHGVGEAAVRTHVGHGFQTEELQTVCQHKTTFQPIWLDESGDPERRGEHLHPRLSSSVGSARQRDRN